MLYYIVSLHQTTTRKELILSEFWLYYIVSLHQTTTFKSSIVSVKRLYYIVSLHQTTTWYYCWCWLSCCIISFLYIKPQRTSYGKVADDGCIISFLYIKPQQSAITQSQLQVVLYRFSTSNHNRARGENVQLLLYYIVSLHQTTTGQTYHSCNLLVVLYRFSTSNHNAALVNAIEV